MSGFIPDPHWNGSRYVRGRNPKGVETVLTAPRRKVVGTEQRPLGEDSTGVMRFIQMDLLECGHTLRSPTVRGRPHEYLDPGYENRHCKACPKESR